VCNDAASAAMIDNGQHLLCRTATQAVHGFSSQGWHVDRHKRVVSSSCGTERVRHRYHSRTAALSQIAHTSQPTHTHLQIHAQTRTYIPTTSPRCARRDCSGRLPPRRRSPGRPAARLQSCARPPWRHDRWRTCGICTQQQGSGLQINGTDPKLINKRR
jgi:hypothetical protein